MTTKTSTQRAKQQRYRERVKTYLTPRRVGPSRLTPVFIGIDGRTPMFRATFLCGHLNTFRIPAPLPDEFQWCPRCMDWQLVVTVDQQW